MFDEDYTQEQFIEEVNAAYGGPLLVKEPGSCVPYLLVFVLVALVVIAILTLLGPQIGNVFSRIVASGI